jgi:hypothetical protein
MKPIILIVTGILSTSTKGAQYSVAERNCIPCRDVERGVLYSTQEYDLGDTVEFSKVIRTLKQK